MTEGVLGRTCAALAYDVLVEECGANPAERSNFVMHATQRGLSEWRFCGFLGFGGKIRLRRYPEWCLYVDCYPEDLTPETAAVIARANARLAELREAA